MADIDSEFLYHTSCEHCGSSDANSVYDDGHTYCFACHTVGNVDDSAPPKMNLPTHRASYKGYAIKIKSRNLNEAICEKFKIYRNGDHLRFHYHNDQAQVIGAKTKTANKEFKYEGESDGRFFGQHLWKSSGKRIVIAEGEIDCASIYQCQPTWPVVSLPNGAASAKKSIQKNWEFLQGFEEIVLFFDSDQPGQDAAKAAAELLPPGKAHIARLNMYKDASEALQKSDGVAIRHAISNAVVFRPDGIIDAKSLINEVTKPIPPADYHYPYKGLDDMMKGIRLGELTTLTAGSGQGKSTVFKDIAISILNQGIPVGGLFLEESNRRTLLSMMSTATGENLFLGEPTPNKLIEAFDSTINNWKFYLFDGFGSFDPDVIYNRIEYLASGLDCKVIFLDHLSILMSGLDGDERRMIDQTMTRLRSLVERTGISLFVICHTTTPPNGQSHEEGGRVQLRSLRGSRSIGQLSDNVIALERDQQSGSKRDASTLRVLKNRLFGTCGPACELRYDVNTCQYTELEVSNDHEEFDPTTDF